MSWPEVHPTEEIENVGEMVVEVDEMSEEVVEVEIEIGNFCHFMVFMSL